MDKSAHDNDTVTEFEGFKVVVDKRYHTDSVEFAIDYVNKLWAKGFVINVNGDGQTGCC